MQAARRTSVGRHTCHNSQNLLSGESTDLLQLLSYKLPQHVRVGKQQTAVLGVVYGNSFQNVRCGSALLGMLLRP